MDFKKFSAISIASIVFASVILAMPTVNNNDESVTYNDEVTPYPFAQRKFVDLSYVSPEVSHMMQRSNLNIEQIRQQQAKLRSRNDVVAATSPIPPAAVSQK